MAIEEPVIPAGLLTVEALHAASQFMWVYHNWHEVGAYHLSPEAQVLLDWCKLHGVQTARKMPILGSHAAMWDRYLAYPLGRTFLEPSSSCLLKGLEKHLPKQLPNVSWYVHTRGHWTP